MRFSGCGALEGSRDRYAERLAVAAGHAGSERECSESESEAGHPSLPGAAIAERTGRSLKQVASRRRASLLSEAEDRPGRESRTASLAPVTRIAWPRRRLQAVCREQGKGKQRE